MGVPATTGQLRTNIADMEIGDYIITNAVFGVSNVAPTIAGNIYSDLSTIEIPVTGSATHGNGRFCMVKVDKGLLVSDRVIQHSISWEILNSGKYIQGKPITFGGTTGVIRSLTGGVAYADENGNKSLNRVEHTYGAFPNNSEWERYVSRFPQDKIQSGKTLDDVFHWSEAYTFTQDTPVVDIMPNTYRITRGRLNVGALNYSISSSTNVLIGFRPVFAYQE